MGEAQAFADLFEPGGALSARGYDHCPGVKPISSFGLYSGHLAILAQDARDGCAGVHGDATGDEAYPRMLAAIDGLSEKIGTMNQDAPINKIDNCWYTGL